jgi:predicted ABC-type ATPase
MPDLYVITGSNGAGKSSFGSIYLPQALHNDTIFDGDKLFMQKRRELYPTQTPSHKEAGRIALEWLHEYFEEKVAAAIKENNTFIYEGHLPEDGNWVTPERFKTAGYRIHFIFFGLTDTALSATRVFERAVMGGHNVPPYEIERNFFGNLYQLNKRYAILDSLQIIDTSESTNPKLLAIFLNGVVNFSIPHQQMPDWFMVQLSALFQKVMTFAK